MQKSVESILRTCAVFVCVALLGISQAIADMDLSGQYDREATLFISVERVYLLRPSDYLLSDQFDQADTTLLCLYAGCRGADRNTGGNLNPSFSLVPCRSLYFKVWALHFKE